MPYEARISAVAFETVAEPFRSGPTKLRATVTFVFESTIGAPARSLEVVVTVDAEEQAFAAARAELPHLTAQLHQAAQGAQP